MQETDRGAGNGVMGSNWIYNDKRVRLLWMLGNSGSHRQLLL